MRHQTTIREEARLEGVGLHTGERSRLIFRPAPANAGVRFYRIDLPGHPVIPASLGFVSATLRGTTLGLNGSAVHTVEHVLSAAAGLEIDNLDVILDAGEPPAMDGSALPFAQALLKAGLREQGDHPRRRLRLARNVLYEGGGSWYRAEPAPRFEISVTYERPHPLVGTLRLDLRLDPDRYLAEIAAARTFCFEEEVSGLRKQGLGRGGSLDNTVVVGTKKFHSSSGGLRFTDELVRHKALDLIGDLALLGRSLDGLRIEAFRPGHAHNVRFAKILNDAARSLRGYSFTSEVTL